MYLARQARRKNQLVKLSLSMGIRISLRVGRGAVLNIHDEYGLQKKYLGKVNLCIVSRSQNDEFVHLWKLSRS